LDGSGRGQGQSAYRILVAATLESLIADKGDLWDSGTVKSEQSIQVAYAGKPLVSHEACWWKVRVWDRAGNDSAWSEPASWTMGVLKPEDWSAKWIGLDGGDNPDAAGPDMGGAKWIWFPEGTPETDAPVATRFFRRVIEIPGDRAVRRATCLLSADNEATLFVNGAKAGHVSDFKVAQEIVLTDHLHPGKNVLALAVHNAGDAPNPAGVIAAFRVEFTSGEAIDLVY
jgi:alpha-L-rhamnosidase